MSSRGEEPERHGREPDIPGDSGRPDGSGSVDGPDAVEGSDVAPDTADAAGTPGPPSPEVSAEDAAGADAAGPDAGAEPEGAPDADNPLTGMSLDEDDLRQLLRGAVQDLEPSPDTLNHLRKAVPARRARRRHALVGAAAAVVLGGAAIPALLHADIVPGGEKPMHAASHSESPGPDEQQQDTGGGQREKSGKDKESAGKDGKKSDRDSGEPTAGATRDPDPSSTLGGMAPSCDPDQLGAATANVGSPDEQGRIYGSFRVENTSTEVCTVEGEGIVGVSARGRANGDRIQVVDHTPGDSATSLLSDPAASPEELVLEPGAAYVVEFAWIPREGGGTTGCVTPTTPPPDSGGTVEGGDGSPGSGADGDPSEGGEGTPDSDIGGSETSGGESDASGGTGTGGGDGGSPAASVSVSHTPDVGDTAVAGTVLPGACAGTVYRTGVLAGS